MTLGDQQRVEDESESSEPSVSAALRMERDLSHGLRDEHDFESIEKNFVSIEGLDGMAISNHSSSNNNSNNYYISNTYNLSSPSHLARFSEPFGSSCAWDCAEDSVWGLVQMHLEQTRLVE